MHRISKVGYLEECKYRFVGLVYVYNQMSASKDFPFYTDIFLI